MSRNPLGYKYLRTWQQANEILELVEEFVTTFPSVHPKTGQSLYDLKDHMLRSARSIVRNIEEGYNRISTKHYIDFLGFSAGSNEELLRDTEKCIKDKIGDLKIAQKLEWLCKGEGKMLNSQINSLENKMISEKTLGQNEMARRGIVRAKEREQKIDKWLDDIRSGKFSSDTPPNLD